METEKIIYGFDCTDLTRSGIFPCKIIRETAKTYTVSYAKGVWTGYTNTVKKSEMRVYSTIFADTAEEALERLKQEIIKTIEANARHIAYLTSKNSDLNERLKQLQEVSGNNGD